MCDLGGEQERKGYGLTIMNIYEVDKVQIVVAILYQLEQAEVI
jgi:hypothetical protein